MSKYQYYYPQNTEEGEKLSLGRDQSSGGAILSCLWFEKASPPCRLYDSLSN